MVEGCLPASTPCTAVVVEERCFLAATPCTAVLVGWWCFPRVAAVSVLEDSGCVAAEASCEGTPWGMLLLLLLLSGWAEGVRGEADGGDRG